MSEDPMTTTQTTETPLPDLAHALNNEPGFVDLPDNWKHLIARAIERLRAPPVLEPEREGDLEAAQVEKEAREEQVRRIVTELASGKAVCRCGDPLGIHLPATCVGAYEDPANLAFGCENCCSHGNEDGWCVPISCVPLAAPASPEDPPAPATTTPKPAPWDWVQGFEKDPAPAPDAHTETDESPAQKEKTT